MAFLVTLSWQCASSKYESEHSAIPNLITIQEQVLLRGGLPDEPDGWEHLSELGIKSVISLEDEEKTEWIAKRVRDMGMAFYSLPMSVYERPSDELVLEFLEIVLDGSRQPVFVFDEHGKDKVGALVAVYRVTVDGLGPKEAYIEAKKMGFWPYRGDAELKKFIHQLNDKKIFFERAKALQK